MVSYSIITMAMVVRVSLLVFLSSVVRVTLSRRIRDYGEFNSKEDAAEGLKFLNAEDFHDDLQLPGFVWKNQIKNSHAHPFLNPMTEEYADNIKGRGSEQEEDDMVAVPDSVWEIERYYTKLHPGLHHYTVPLSQACMALKVIYNNGWVQSAGDGNVDTAHQRAVEVIAEAEKHYNRFTSFQALPMTVQFGR